MQTAFLCYVQPLNNGICTAYEYISRLFLSNFIWSITELEIEDEFNLLQNLYLYTENSIGATSTRPFGEVGGKFPLLFSSQAHFAKIEDKKVIAKI